MPFPVPRWDDARGSEALARLALTVRPSLVCLTDQVRELFDAFVQALRRQPAPMPGPRHTDWTAESLDIAANLAATAAEAAFAAHVGSVITVETIPRRSDVTALFPWEMQVPGETGEPVDRVLRTDDTRVLTIGRHPGQLPLRVDAGIHLRRLWKRGDVLEGYGRILQAMEFLGLTICGDAAFDARALGKALARRADQGETLATDAVDPEALKAWKALREYTCRRAWAHRLHVLRFEDIRGDPRWSLKQILPRVYKAASEAGSPGQVDELSLARLGLVHLLDTMVVPAPDQAPRTETLHAEIGEVADRTYMRRPLYKTDQTVRWLDVPNPALARAQRRLVEALRPVAPFAGVATAFEPGRSPALQARFHEGAEAAVVLDITDFFGSIRPRHLRWAFHPRPGAEAGAQAPLLHGGTREARESLLQLLFAGEERTRWLPQGAPSSPWAANLAAHPMDRRLRAWARQRGLVHYSRYADDLVISLQRSADATSPIAAAEVERFIVEAEQVLRAAVRARGWTVNEAKTRRWRRGERTPLTLCGIEVPMQPGAPCRLPRAIRQRARAALHRLRCGEELSDRGLLAWAWSATGQVGWLAWGNTRLERFALMLAGPILSASLLAGWADEVDG